MSISRGNSALSKVGEFTLLEYAVVVAIITLLLLIMTPTCTISPGVHVFKFAFSIALMTTSAGCALLCLLSRRWKAVSLFMVLTGVGVELWSDYRVAEDDWQARRAFSHEASFHASWIRHEQLIPLSPWEADRHWSEERTTRITGGAPTHFTDRVEVDRAVLPSKLPKSWRRVGDFVINTEPPPGDDLPTVVVGYSATHLRTGVIWVLHSDEYDDWVIPTQADVDRWNADRAAVGLSPIPGLP